jgi:hypothetical protein
VALAVRGLLHRHQDRRVVRVVQPVMAQQAALEARLAPFLWLARRDQAVAAGVMMVGLPLVVLDLIPCSARLALVLAAVPGQRLHSRRSLVLLAAFLAAAVAAHVMGFQVEMAQQAASSSFTRPMARSVARLPLI